MRCQILLLVLWFILGIGPALEYEPSSRLPKADHVTGLQGDVLLLWDEPLVYKGAMSASQVVDQQVSRVLMLENCMATRDCRVLLEEVHNVRLAAQNVKGLF